MPLIKPGDDLTSIILKAIRKIGGLREGDVVVIASKAVATAQGRFRQLDKIIPSSRAKEISSKSGQSPEFVELVIREADKILNVCKGAVLTIKHGLICANAGADLSNAPKGHAILMPVKPDRVANEILGKLTSGKKERIGLIISDSVVHPLRLGTVGQAIGVAGIKPVIDCRGKMDIYGNTLRITFRAIADQLATAAQLAMGEDGERVPVVVIRNVEIKLTERQKISPKISKNQCLYLG